MGVEEKLRCPRCGGGEQKDLTGIRRGTGAVLTIGSLGAFLALGVSDPVTPLWALLVLGGVFLLGILAVAGAGRARYCPRCNQRMEPPPTL